MSLCSPSPTKPATVWHSECLYVLLALRNPRRRETPQRGIAGPSTPALGGEGPSSLPAPASTEPLLVLAGSSTDDAGKPERCIAADVGGQAPGGAASAKPAAVSMLVPSM
ncbi:hypothetical protein Q4I32_007432 [Leishmania shawi]|uniref:Uncharacterized protein n=1 Tax=Leishmania shawi TaxID=5680 RepID=A0AAW3BAH0_9TRYP